MKDERREYYFAISRTDRICLVILITVLLGWEYIKYAFPQPKPVFHFSTLHAIIPVESESEPLENTSTDRRTYMREKSKSKTENPSSGSISLPAEERIAFPVAIETASKQELQAAGFSSFTAGNIAKYMAAGGKISNASDLMKIYGMDETQWEKVKNNIAFPEAIPASEYKTQPNGKKYPTEIYDLNTITHEQLVLFPGIGDVLAGRILKFRESLGGFIEVSQLEDCFGLPPETISSITPYLKVDSPPMRIPINDIDTEKFNHPYLPKKIGRVLKAWKTHHGLIRDEQDLKQIYPPDSTWYNRLLPYIDFGIAWQ